MTINIGSRRELFVDDSLLDPALTTAAERLHHPVRRERVMTNDAPWEADGWVYYTVFEDNGLFRMYYLSMPMYNREHTKHAPPFMHINYAESTDGVQWKKPKLGLHAFQGSADNNIVVITDTMDAFHVFRDTNPACPLQERYKAVYTKPGNHLWCMLSGDGIHFREGWKLTDQGKFDSHNTAFWDGDLGVYVCYFRNFHDRDGVPTRDIRRMESVDFRDWSVSAPITYEDSRCDFQMYTNGVQPYFRAPHLYVGLPARYVERGEWTANYERLCGADHRRWRMGFHPRFGLAVTDGLFMSSRDGKHFRRWNEAFLRPGPESRKHWVYGDGYAGYGLLPTATCVEGEDPELSLYVPANCWSDEPVELYRYTLRMDGFVSRSAGYGGGAVVTRPIAFRGSALRINFATSAAGSLRVILENPSGEAIQGFDSGKLFGDKVDRRVDFSGNLSALSGSTLRLRFELCDADLYAFQFIDGEA